MQLAFTLSVVLGATALLHPPATSTPHVADSLPYCLLGLVLPLIFARWVQQMRRFAPASDRLGWLGGCLNAAELWHARAYLAGLFLILVPGQGIAIARPATTVLLCRWAGEVVLVLGLLAPLLAAWYLLAPGDAGRGPTPRERLRYVCQACRQWLLLPLAPLGLMLLLHAGVRWGWPEASEAALGLTGLAGLAMIAAGFPLLLRFAWPTGPLPAGPARQAIVATLARADVRVTEILQWDTAGTILNGALVGMDRRCRYLLMSDGLLNRLNSDEVAAVAAHEAAHARHAHLPRLACTLLVPLLLLAVTSAATGIGGSPSSLLPQCMRFGVIFTVWGVMFRCWSRAFEHQADWTACQILADSTGGLAAAVALLGRTLTALQPDPNGDWLHPAPQRRWDFLLACLADSEVATRFARRLTLAAKIQTATLIALAILWVARL